MMRWTNAGTVMHVGLGPVPFLGTAAGEGAVFEGELLVEILDDNLAPLVKLDQRLFLVERVGASWRRCFRGSILNSGALARLCVAVHACYHSQDTRGLGVRRLGEPPKRKMLAVHSRLPGNRVVPVTAASFSGAVGVVRHLYQDVCEAILATGEMMCDTQMKVRTHD